MFPNLLFSDLCSEKEIIILLEEMTSEELMFYDLLRQHNQTQGNVTTFELTWMIIALQITAVHWTL